MTLIFPHIPKAAGTSLKVQLENSGLKIFLDYEFYPSSTAWLRTRSERKNAECRLLDFGNFDVVFGHFPINRYVRPQYKYATLVRDPFDRAVSHYNYLIFRYNNNRLAMNHLSKSTAEKILSGETKFANWCKEYDMARYYKHYLNYWDSGKFEFVGDLSRYDLFIARLSDYLKTDLSTDVIERENKNYFLKKSDVSGSEIERAKNIMAKEYEWYEKFTNGII